MAAGVAARIKRCVSQAWPRGLAGLALAFAMLAASGHRAEAHPHVWAFVETEVVYSDTQQLVGLRHKWTFDEMYSAFAVQGLDVNGDGAYDRQELAELAQVNMESLKEFAFFTFANLGEDTMAFTEPRDYHAEFANGVVTLYFTLPLTTPILPGGSDFSFAVYDPTFYVAFSMVAENPVRIGAGAPSSCATKVDLPKAAETEARSLSETFFDTIEAAVGFGAQFASRVVVRCQ